MNVTELARKLKISTEDLLEVLPQIGFDIGRRAIKIDDRLAQKIIGEWSQKIKELKEKLAGEEEKLEEQVEEEEIKEVRIPHVITVKDFAERMDLPVTQVLTELMKAGILSAQNEKIDFETASIVAEDLGYKTSPEDGDQEGDDNQEEKLEKLLGGEKDLKYRAPVIVVMGHVDHGKTKLLDAIRKTNVVDAEAGGITQHIGAYQVKKNGKELTFIDTPGHEAFTAMRSRGAKIADIAILVVAADDGVKPQTKEAIDIIKAAKLPMIVAINKIDKEGANIDKVKSELAELNLTPEDWGGETICVPISAKQNTGIDDILDMLLLVADMEKENIKANAKGKPVATVIESHIDKGEGPVATILVKNGIFKTGHFLAIDNNLYGKIKAMKNWQGENISDAGPSMPVKILGFKSAPFVGDIIEGKETDKGLAKSLKARKAKEEIAIVVGRKKKEDVKKLNLILKADVLGSLEAIISSIEKISHPQIKIDVVGKNLGNITEGDILQAEASGAEIIGFHVGANPGVEDLAVDKKVIIKYYSIIYKLLEDLTAELEGLLEAEIIKHEVGKLKVLAIFKTTRDGQVVGGKVIEGKIIKEAKVEILRSDKKVGQGKIIELQSGKADVNEVVEGEECGISLKCDTTVVEGDVLEIYSEEKKEQKIE